MTSSDDRICPKCGAKALPVVYGLPTPAMRAAADRGEVALGGCTLPPDEEMWRFQCTDCHHLFPTGEEVG